MADFQIKVDLLKLQGAAIKDMTAADGRTMRCVVIPIWEAGIYEGKKGVYLDLRAVETQNPQYEDTHFVKQSVTREKYSAMTEEQREAIPIVGNLKPVRKAQSAPLNYGNTPAREEAPLAEPPGLW